MLKIANNLSLPLEAVTQTFAILAKRGCGKTYTGAVMVEEMLSAGQQVIVADPIGVWWGLRSSADGKSAGFPIVVFGGEHSDVPLEEMSGEVIAGAIIENGFSAILDLSLLRKAAQVRFMTAFAETLYRLNRKPLHLAVDEADAFCPQRPMHDEARLLGAFEDIVRRGRARGIGVTLITQRAAVINKNVLTQCEVLICLRTIAPQDREAIDAWIEVHGTENQREKMMAELPSLPIGTAFFWSPGWLDIFKRVEVRKRITFDSSSTPKVGEKIIRPKEVAAVDLNRLGDQIKSTVERQKENDPAELKRRIRELEKQASKVPAPAAAKRIEVPVISESDFKRIDRAVTLADGIFATVKLDLKKVEAAVAKGEKLFSRLKALQTTAGQSKPPSHALAAPRLTPPATQRPRPATFSGMNLILEPQRAAQKERADGEARFGRCERAILTALAQYPQGRTAVQVALLSEYSVSSGGFNNSLGKLRSLGYITRTNPIQITSEGVAALGDFRPLPTGMDLVSHWVKKLQKCEAAILLVLVNSYPATMSAQDVADATGYSAASGGFNNALGRLRTLELITRGRPMKATDEFFQ